MLFVLVPFPLLYHFTVQDIHQYHEGRNDHGEQHHTYKVYHTAASQFARKPSRNRM